MPIKGVLFDLDDTLFDHHHATRHATATLWAHEAAFAVWTIEELHARHNEILDRVHPQVLTREMSIEAARRKRFGQLLADATQAPAAEGLPDQLARFYRSAYEAAWRPVPGASTLLAALRAEGLRIAIVTNNLILEQQDKLRRCGLDVLIDALITSEETRTAKPDPAIFHAALDRLDLGADDVVMVGDAWATDIAGAKAAGIRPIWFNWREAPTPDASVVELRSLEPVDTARTRIRHF